MRICPTPNCGMLLTEPGPCPRCERRRKASHAAFYDHAWRTYSLAWLARFPICGMRRDGQLHPEHSRCAQRGLHVKATCTDHIVALRDGGARLDPRNHQSLCTACNAAKVVRL